MALRNLYKEIKGLKLKEVPAHLKPMLSIGYAKNAVRKGLDNYHAKRATSPRAQTARRRTLIVLRFSKIDDTVKDKHLSLLVAFTLFSVIGVLSEAQLCNTWLIYLV
ncbi:hypothetical protein RDI58_015877 [Solanum bulbocastanum]|uniref:Uncharacterized protein n=1 Tax=Solanum bulbocastanum TaxID=147425 RepID=A0AAN8TLB6_SOLBU